MQQEDSITPRKPRGKPFSKGADTRRHVHSATCGHELYQFTKADQSNGFWSAMAVMGISIGEKLRASGRWPTYQGRRAA